MGGMDEIKITPPSAKACRICATVHDPQDPHDRDSLYYQNWFRKRFKRFPTWNDAMAHCSEITKACFKAKLIRRGIDPEDEAENDRQRLE